MAFFALSFGAWVYSANLQKTAPNRAAMIAFVAAGGIVLALINTVTIALDYPNRQHSAYFYKLAAGTYPIVAGQKSRSVRRPPLLGNTLQSVRNECGRPIPKPEPRRLFIGGQHHQGPAPLQPQPGHGLILLARRRREGPAQAPSKDPGPTRPFMPR